MHNQSYQKIMVDSELPQIPSFLQGFNRRWFASNCKAIYLCYNTDGVVQALNEAISLYGQHVKIKGGGHCYEDFVFGESTQAIIDINPINDVGHDLEKGYYLGAGGTNWASFKSLFRDFGKALPGGSCYSVGLGGHICGGGYGLLSRLHGLTVDWLTGVELVVKDWADQSARSIYVSKESTGDEADLFWAQCGGGGGNFGVITRYYFKELPDAPQKAYLSSYAFQWSEMSEEKLYALLTWYAQFASRSDNWNQFGLFALNHIANGELHLTIQTAFNDSEQPKALAQVAQQTEELNQITNHRPATRPMYGHGAYYIPHTSTAQIKDLENGLMYPEYTFYEAVQTLNTSGPNRRGKYKSAYMRKGFPENQVTTIFKHLKTYPQGIPPSTMAASLLQVDSYGGYINTIAPNATAIAQRSSILKLQYQTYWISETNNAAHLEWIRDFYSEMYQSYGGTPNPTQDPEQNVDGCYYNYPDVDLNNIVGYEGAMRLYFLENLDRLVKTKQRWDSNNYFNSAQSIPLSL